MHLLQNLHCSSPLALKSAVQISVLKYLVFILLQFLPLAEKCNLLSCCVADNKNWLAQECPAEFTVSSAELNCIEINATTYCLAELWILENCLIRRKTHKTASIEFCKHRKLT